MKLAYEEIVDFFASAPSAEQILKHKASARVKARVSFLLDRKKNGTLTADQQDELNSYAELEHIMRMVKAKTMVRLKQVK